MLQCFELLILLAIPQGQSKSCKHHMQGYCTMYSPETCGKAQHPLRSFDHTAASDNIIALFALHRDYVSYLRFAAQMQVSLRLPPGQPVPLPTSPSPNGPIGPAVNTAPPSPYSCPPPLPPSRRCSTKHSPLYHLVEQHGVHVILQGKDHLANTMKQRRGLPTIRGESTHSEWTFSNRA